MAQKARLQAHIYIDRVRIWIHFSPSLSSSPSPPHLAAGTSLSIRPRATRRAANLSTSRGGRPDPAVARLGRQSPCPERAHGPKDAAGSQRLDAPSKQRVAAAQVVGGPAAAWLRACGRQRRAGGRRWRGGRQHGGGRHRHVRWARRA